MLQKVGTHCGHYAKSFATGAFLERIVVKRANNDLFYNTVDTVAVINRLTLTDFPEKWQN